MLPRARSVKSFEIICNLFSFFFTGLSKDSSPNPVRDDAFLPKQRIGSVFIVGQGAAWCEWCTNFIGWEKVVADLAFLHFPFLYFVLLFAASDAVPLTEAAGLSLMQLYWRCFLEMTAFLKSSSRAGVQVLHFRKHTLRKVNTSQLAGGSPARCWGGGSAAGPPSVCSSVSPSWAPWKRAAARNAVKNLSLF